MIRDLGKRLKTERVKCNLRQRDVSKRINTDTSSISAYEREIATPSAEILMKLAVIYNVSVDYLLGIEKRKSVYVDLLTDEQIEVLRIITEQFEKDNKKR